MNRMTLAILLLVCTSASARNIDLSTVPRRDSVSLTIYNSEDLTLVRERRTVTFKKGVNPLQFSWANTLIDPTSVELHFVTDPDKFDLLDTTFPHDKPQMLYWNVQSDIDGPATIEISYFTSGITWSADYTAIADKEEKTAKLDGFVRVTNNSGEEYEEAHIRLIVGTINLVEKIAELAKIPVSDVDKLAFQERRELQNQAAKGMVLQADRSAVGGAMMPATVAPEAPKQIIKEGLSEYFVFAIEGTETIHNGWSKRMRAIQADGVPLKIQYRYREPEYGPQLVRMYLMTNDEKSKLGQTPLPDGTVRIFRDNGRGGLSYLAQQTIKYIPIGDKIELNLGPDPEVVFDLIKTKVWRDHIWLQLDGANVLREFDPAGNMKIDVHSRVVGWADHDSFAQRIRNDTARPIDVEIRRSFPGDVTFRSALDPTLHDYQTVQFSRSIAPGEKAELDYEVIRQQGRNARQNHVMLEAAK